MLKNGERRVLVTYRIQKAKSVLKEAYDNAKLGHWTLVGNRLYYTVYHMAQALLLDKGQSGDYDDMYNATEDEVKPYFPLVESFISVMEELITFK